MKKRPTNAELLREFDAVDEQEFDCAGDLMCKIKAGSVKMRSRWVVLSEYLGLRTTWILLLIMIMFLVNLNLYILSKSPELGFYEFGSSGLWFVARNLPYGWWAVAFGLIALAIVLMKHFSFTYKTSFTAISTIVVSVAFLTGTVTYATGVNEDLYNYFIEEPGEGNSMIAKLLCFCTNRFLNTDNALMGEVMYVSHDFFIVQTPDLDVVSVNHHDQTLWAGALEPLKYATVRMLGRRDSDKFIPSHVKVFTEEQMDLVRTGEDCTDKEKWEKKKDIAERRRQVVNNPYTPAMAPIQLIKSVR